MWSLWHKRRRDDACGRERRPADDLCTDERTHTHQDYCAALSRIQDTKLPSRMEDSKDVVEASPTQFISVSRESLNTSMVTIQCDTDSPISTQAHPDPSCPPALAHTHEQQQQQPKISQDKYAVNLAQFNHFVSTHPVPKQQQIGPNTRLAGGSRMKMLTHHQQHYTQQPPPLRQHDVSPVAARQAVSPLPPAPAAPPLKENRVQPPASPPQEPAPAVSVPVSSVRQQSDGSRRETHGHTDASVSAPTRKHGHSRDGSSGSGSRHNHNGRHHSSQRKAPPTITVTKPPDDLRISMPPLHMNGDTKGVHKGGGGGGDIDLESGVEVMTTKTMPKDIKRAFSLKVYTIIFVQLVVTVGIASVFSIDPRASAFAKSSKWFLIGIAVFWLASLCSMAFFADCVRLFPQNFILLAIFTACEGVILGLACAQLSSTILLLAFSGTASVVLVMTLSACLVRSKEVGTRLSLILALATIVVFFVLTFTLLGQKIRMETVWGCLLALLFSGFIVYDTQAIVGGGHSRFVFTPDDYVFAAFCLYYDIVTLFLVLLCILGSYARQAV
mmetsp:Transcript_7494/g.18303  ORF Transcript_7494/g.18303 Transcript_7494/m.18303 type:complete len:556 (+) Transcript_7494:266-1933(+)